MLCRFYRVLAELEVSAFRGARARHESTCRQCASEARARSALDSALFAEAGALREVSPQFVAGVRRGVGRSGTSKPELRTWGLPVRLALAAVVVAAVTISVVEWEGRTVVSRDVAMSDRPAPSGASVEHGLSKLAGALARAPRAIPWEQAHDYLELSSAISEGRLPRLRGGASDAAADATGGGSQTGGGSPTGDGSPTEGVVRSLGETVGETLDPLAVVDTTPWKNLARRFGVDRFTLN